MKAILLCLVAICVAAFAAPKDVNVRIIGGEEARRGEFPYMVSVNLCVEEVLGQPERCQHVCGGTIVDQDWVLTAAHCVTEAPLPGRYEIIAGVHELEGDNPDKQVRRVDRHTIHPDFPNEEGPSPFDIVLLRLEEPLQFSRRVHEVELPEEEFEFEHDVIIAGWGSIGPDPDRPDDHNMPNTLHYVRTEIIPEEECSYALDVILGGEPHPLNHDANICTGPLTGGVSICSGDSGDPVVDYAERRLIGIASWTVTPCGIVGAPSVHNRISFFTRWILDTIREIEPEPEPEPEPGPEPEPEPEPEPGPEPVLDLEPKLHPKPVLQYL